MDIKLHVIEAYFQEWTETVGRAKKLMEKSEYHLEGMLVLSCYIGAFARLRYPSERRDAVSYKDVVLRYSGNEAFYANVDLLFMYQWPRSAFQNVGDYKKLKNHTELVASLSDVFGDEASLKGDDSVRYQPPQKVLDVIQMRPFKGLDMTNLKANLSLFSNLEILYRVVRCSAVHENTFPLVNEVYYPDTGEKDFAANHVITGDVIFETCSQILARLRDECVQSRKMPFELWT